MNGVRNLKRYEASDMVDVFHTLFEEDTIPLFEDHAEVKSRAREMIYGDLYQRKYKYAVKRDQQQRALGFDHDLDPPEPGPSQSQEVKPYIAPTDPEDLPRILDAPLG